MSSPLSVHTADQVRALDRRAIDDLGIPSYTLMTRAGEAALNALRSSWPAADRVSVVCGPGNNGGDGYVLARLAREQRMHVTVTSTVDPAGLRGDARRAHDDFIAAGGVVSPWSDDDIRRTDVIVDAIFGIGLSRAVDAQVAARIEAMNASNADILALDIPSGLHADTGQVLGVAVSAQRTLTFLGMKVGFYVGEGPDHAGVVMFEDLGVPAATLALADPVAHRIDENLLGRVLPPRRRTAHKGEQGRVLVLGGSIGMAGAARMTAEATLRSGAGLVTVATRAENVPSILSGRPELMARGVHRREELLALIERADVLALGPGLGQDDWARTMFDTALATDKPAVIDADALNLLAQSPRKSSRWILTPHPGEAGRLLDLSTADIQRDRLSAARQIATRYGGVIVLKGAGTLVVTEGELPSICDRGNPGMASPGMGDVLTGIIAGIVAQSANLPQAARAGVLVHAIAGDMAARRGERGLLATDLYEYLRTCVNPLQRP